MKTILKLFLALGLSFSMILNVFAIDAPTNLKVDNKGETSVELSWDKVEGSYMYIVSYSKEPLENKVDIKQTEFIEETKVTVNDLNSETTYYFGVQAIDEEADESVFSEEITLDLVNKDEAVSNEGTSSSAESTESQDVVESTDESKEVENENKPTEEVKAEPKENFVFKGVDILSETNITLVFSNELDNEEGTEREFKIYNKDDNLDSYDVVASTIDPDDSKKLILELDRSLEDGKEYEVVIIAIKNKELDNIKSGIDSIENFKFLSSKIEKQEPNEVVEKEVNKEEEKNIELNSAGEEPKTVAGKDISEDDMKKTTLGAAKNTSELPKTGPEHILILLLSVMLGGLMFVFKFKKS